MAFSPTEPPRRRPAVGGYARGEKTRARIIEAAMMVFAEEGYVRASTRRIAAEAEVNLPALQYYFDNKEGLHLACAQMVADRAARRYGEMFRLAQDLVSTGDADRAAATVCDLYDLMLSSSAGDDTPLHQSRFLASAQADPAGPAYALIRGQIIRPRFEVFAALTATAIEGSAEFARLLTLFLMNQLSAVSVHRDNTLAAMGWSGIGPAELAVLRKTFTLTVSATLAEARLSGKAGGKSSRRPKP